MTDRYNAFVVILEKDIRDDDAEQIINAIKMVKGVLDVTPHIADPRDAIATTRAKQEIMERIVKNIIEDQR